MALMETEDIIKILPHRYPMLLVDKIIEFDHKERIVGLKNLTINEEMFQGHFPGHPVMPGVLQIEAMAQTAGVMLGSILKRESSVAYFLSIDNAKFRKVLKPGDQMRIEIQLLKIKLRMSKVHGRVLCDGDLACEADLMFAYREE